MYSPIFFSFFTSSFIVLLSSSYLAVKFSFPPVTSPILYPVPSSIVLTCIVIVPIKLLYPFGAFVSFIVIVCSPALFIPIFSKLIFPVSSVISSIVFSVTLPSLLATVISNSAPSSFISLFSESIFSNSILYSPVFSSYLFISLSSSIILSLSIITTGWSLFSFGLATDQYVISVLKYFTCIPTFTLSVSVFSTLM